METIQTTSQYDKQLAIEEEMLGAGITRYQNQLAKATEKNIEASTAAGMRLLKEALAPFTKAIEHTVQNPGYGQHCKVPRFFLYLTLLEPDVIAYITAKSVFNSITKRLTLTHAAINVGSLIEDEVRFRYFENQNAAFYNSVYNRVKMKSSYDYRRTVLIHSMGKADIPWESWITSDKLQLGQLCINLLADSTKYIEIKPLSTVKKDKTYFVLATQETLDWLEKEHKRCELLTPTFMPMVVPPKDWTTPYDGGYYGCLKNRLKLVKTFNHSYLEELENIEMPEVYRAINAIQKTAWKINTPVLEILETFWDSDSEVANLPPREDRQPRRCPFPSDLKAKEMAMDQLEIFRDWKREAATIYESNVMNRSKRLLISKILYIANKFKDEPEIFFPHMLDFRGRVYAVPHFLNPQGPDVAKALLTFALGKPIQNEKAAHWLAIHGANVYGYDKVSLADRVQFIQDMEAEILAIAAHPLENLKWTEADKPWQFLAFCFEWAGFIHEGYGFVSHLPVALDGSCNGLQHFSAMLRDEIGGQAVNLLPSDKPEDIYQRVADVVIQKLQIEIETGTPNATMAQNWLSFGINRKMTKRPVMILPYGGTRHACREYIEAYVRESLIEGKENPFAANDRENIFDACLYLAGIVWESIGEVVVAAREVMGWLRKASSYASQEGLPVNWTTPSGFPVQQAYKELRTRRIRTQLSGNLLKPILHSITEYTDTIDKRRQANGISPNFVHSMDAAALHLYVNQASQHGIESFSLIHDSYGTLAADTEVSAQCIREVFVTMYQEDVLETFRTELLDLLSPRNANKLPLIPPKGTLDLEAVKQSVFFFA